MAIEGIDKSPYSRVYDKIVAKARTCPELEAAGVEWIAWDGGGDEAMPTSYDAPTIEMIPSLSSQDWMSPDAFRGDMVIGVRMYVPNTRDARDCLDLWATFERAIYPLDAEARDAFQKDLRGESCGQEGGSCDAETGLVRFVRPATIRPDFDGGEFAHFECYGELSISIIRPLNP